jgi:hypothetical protein
VPRTRKAASARLFMRAPFFLNSSPVTDSSVLQHTREPDQLSDVCNVHRFVMQERMPDRRRQLADHRARAPVDTARGAAACGPGGLGHSRAVASAHGLMAVTLILGDRSCLFAHCLQFFRGEAWLASAGTHGLRAQGRVRFRFVASDGPAVAVASFDILFQECTRFDRFTEVTEAWLASAVCCSCLWVIYPCTFTFTVHVAGSGRRLYECNNVGEPCHSG